MSAKLFLLFISYPSYPFSFGSVGSRVQSTYLTSTSCESVIERIQRVGFLFLLSRSEVQVRRREDLQSASQKRMSRTTTNGRKLKRIKVYGTKMMLNQALFFLKNAPGTPLPSSCCQMDSWLNRLLFQYLNFLPNSQLVERMTNKALPCSLPILLLRVKVVVIIIVKIVLHDPFHFLVVALGEIFLPQSSTFSNAL